MVKISIDGDKLKVTIEGFDKGLSLKTHLDVPLSHVRGARPDADAARGRAGLKMGGARIPGLITAGTFRKDGEWIFFDVHHAEKALVIELDHEHYKRLVVEVEDPSSTANMINEAMRNQ